MHGCDACRELLLDHLYDLLDESQSQGLRDHLTGCAECQAALEQARAQQQLLAAAARVSFPDVAFTPPAETVKPAPASGVRAVLLPVKPRIAKPVRWNRWAVAAGILIAVAGLGVAGGFAGNDYASHARIVKEKEVAVAEARNSLTAVERDLKEAALERDRRIDEVRHAILGRELRMEVQGPHTVQAGAPAEFIVRTFDLNNEPTAANISADLAGGVPTIKAKGGEGADKKTDQSPTVREIGVGVYQISLPPSLKLEPGRALGMSVSATRKDDKRQLSLQGTLSLTAPVYLTHLATDKPMYQPGEVVRFRSLTVDRGSMRPAAEDFRIAYTLTQPDGSIKASLQGNNNLVRLDEKKQSTAVNGPDGKPIKGVGVGEFPLDDQSPGGEYTLTVNEEYGRFAATTRKFIVNRYQKPRLDKKLDFNKSSYGVGDEVSAQVSAKRADGGPVKNSPVTIAVNVDDQIVGADGKPGKPFAGSTDDSGSVVAKFRLPAKIERGQASLTVTFTDGGAVEPIVRTIPVVLKKLNVEFFPEGGDLIAGLHNRVYLQVRTPLGKPAQLNATLLEDGKPTATTTETLSDDKQPGVNQGHGVFEFTPRPGSKYALRIDSPAGIEQLFELPPALADGVVLTVPGGVYEADQGIRAVVRSSKPRSLLVGAYCRGRLLDTVRLEKGQTEAVLKPISGAGGVCRITVFEELPGGGAQKQLRPVAERLVYRHPKERLDISLATAQKSHVPGQKVNLSVLATNERKEPTAAIVMLAVVDKSVLTMADEKTGRAMPTHLLLTSEVRNAEDLEYADFLIGQHEKAARSLDLLLGTQGWRRFAEQSPEQFRDRLVKEARNLPEAKRLQREQDAERLLVLIGRSTPKKTDFDEQKIDRATEDFNDKADRLQGKYEEASTAVTEAGSDGEYRSALTRVVKYEQRLERARTLAVPVFAMACLALLCLAGLQALRRADRPASISAGLALACCLLLVACVSLSVGSKRTPLENREVAQLEMPKVGDPGNFLPEDNFDLFRPEANALGGGGFAGGAPVAPAGTGNLGGVPIPQPAPPGALMPVPTRAKTPEADRGKDDKEVARLPGKAAPLAKGKAKQKDADDGKPGGQAGEGKPREQLDRARMLEQARRPQAEVKKRLAQDRDMRGGRGGFGGGFGKGDAKAEQAFVPLAPFVVREYAHKNTTPEGAARSDFAETIAWHPVLVLSEDGKAEDGKAEVSFDLCDSVTSFEAIAFAHTLDGRLGAATRLIDSRLPFTLSPKVPVEVTAGDRIDLPLAVANNSSDPRSVEVKLTRHDGLKLLAGLTESKFDLKADSRLRRLFSFTPSTIQGKARVRFEGKAGPFIDGIEETITVVPDGFPITGQASDLLEKSATHKVKLPEWIAGTLSARVDVYPSTLADLQKGLEGLLREPYGCFEQSSTTNYPNVLILDYLRTVDKADPALEKRIRDLLDRGYQRLTSFECKETSSNKKRGYEWFGGTAPPHEALTAYGLMQFSDMARVHSVDADMMKRTKGYLLAQRDGKGGFARNQRALDTFGRAPDHITNAYIVWALTEMGRDEDLTKELDALRAKAKDNDDPYFLSLVALALSNRGKGSEASDILKAIAKKQKDDGHLDAGSTSITGSGGQALQIETTALAVLGWLKANEPSFGENIRKAVKWIGQQRGGHGAFGSTQSTILALKALIAHAKANKRVPEGGELRLYVGETKVAHLPFLAGVDKPLTIDLPDAEKHLKAGENKLRVEITGEKNVFPHTLSWSYRTVKPDSAAKVPVKLTTKLAKTDLNEGDSVRLNVRIENATGAGQGMAVAIVGLPAGLILPEDLKQLKEHCRLNQDEGRPLVSAFEVRGRELILYWRDLAKGQVIDVPVELVARVPGKYRGPASRAYLYYNAEVKDWIEPLAVTVTAR